MSSQYTIQITVSDDVVDRNGHVNNVNFVQWMQDIAIEHSNERGCDHDFYQSLATTWVARSHHIDYLSSAFLHEQLEITTWVDRFRKVSCFRKYEFRRVRDQAIIARAETEWVYVSNQTGRPKKIDAEVIARFA